MLAQTERGYLIITDLTGYTGYLTGSELDHAQDVLRDLIETVIGSLRPVLRLAKLEGDAAFAYAPSGKVDGSMLLDVLENCYFSFQRRRRTIQQATSCPCRACAQIPLLNLKVFAHDGEFIRHRIAGREELAGADVILVHRLLKNTVADTLRMPAYALLTEACVQSLGLDAPGLGMRPHMESYEHIGDVQTFVHDLEARWRDEQERRRVYVAAAKADGETSGIVPAPPAVVWNYLTSAAKRLQYQPGTDRLDQVNPAGRRGPGTINHCAHGKDVVLEEIVDWRPFEYFTVHFTVMGVPIHETFELAAVDEGTRVTLRQKIPRSKKPREAWAEMRGMYLGMMQEMLAGLSALIVREAAGERAASESPSRA